MSDADSNGIDVQLVFKNNFADVAYDVIFIIPLVF